MSIVNDDEIMTLTNNMHARSLDAFIQLKKKHPQILSDKDTKSKNSPQEVIIKPDILDTSALKEGSGVKESFRPTIFSEYIGQEMAKERIMTYINGCKKHGDEFPHVFISAPAGCGKTVFANIIANTLGGNFVKCGAVDLKTPQQLVDKIVECDGGTLFIDEIHKLSNALGTFMLPILEEGLIMGKKIKPFVCIGATTHKGNLSENLAALVQRFLPIELEHYNKEELGVIINQFKQKMYPEVPVDNKIIMDIVSNCKYTPRIAIRLLKEFIYTNDLDRVKKNNHIIKDGLTSQDIKVLNYLNGQNGCGKNSIAKYLNVEPKTYEFEIEPYLILKQFIIVSSKRKITEKGKEFLKEVNNV